MNGTKSLVTKRIGINMQKIYVVKSFGPENGYVNLKAFSDQNKAVEYSKVIDKQIPIDIKDEFVEIEELEILV
jgi:hypothetical protein